MSRETEYVNVILTETFFRTSQEPNGLVRDTDFLNMVATMVREQDPEALSPQPYFGQFSGGEKRLNFIHLEGNAQKIMTALGQALAGPAKNGSILLSEVFPASSGKTREEARQIMLTVNDKLYNVVKKEKLPVGGVERVNGKVVDFTPGA